KCAAVQPPAKLWPWLDRHTLNVGLAERLIALQLAARATMAELRVTQIDHVSVVITDVERSRRFYRDLLRLREIAKPRTFDFVVLWFDLGNQHLHLLLKDRPDTLSPRHFALRVGDANAARAYFRQHGVAVQ